jgi:hypothetical protein
MENQTMKVVEVQIKGVTALLQHRFTEDAESNPSTRKVLVNNGTPRSQAEKVAYRNNGHFYFPGAAIGRLLREAGGGHKLRGTRKSAKYVVPSAVLVLQDTVDLLSEDGQSHLTDFEVDSRPVVIPSTKGRIMRHRPRFDQWGARFTLRINETILPVDFIHQLMDEGGLQLGIGDYRPEKSGPFGTFQVIEWNEQK